MATTTEAEDTQGLARGIFCFREEGDAFEEVGPKGFPVVLFPSLLGTQLKVLDYWRNSSFHLTMICSRLKSQ